jgi:hypothetical protein
MTYIAEILANNILLLPNMLCDELGFAVGDILVCELAKDRSEMKLLKHADQTLTDEEILAAGNLTRVISFPLDE